MIFRWIKNWLKPTEPWRHTRPDIRVYPCQRSCVKNNMSQVKPEQMPPLMVRKAAWRR
jgi:hypothetical protein